MIDVSRALRRARAALGLDLDVLAEAAGLDPGTLAAYESGARQVPGDVLWRLSDVLGIPIEDVDTEALLGRHLEVIAVRFRADQRALPDRVRLAVARTASAARDYYGMLPFAERVTGVPTSPSDEWKAAESSELWYPAFDDIPIERRHAVAKLAFELWVKEEITTSRLRHALRVHLSHDQLSELAELYLGTLVG